MKKLVASILSLAFIFGLSNNAYAFEQANNGYDSERVITRRRHIVRPIIQTNSEDEKSFWSVFFSELWRAARCTKEVADVALPIMVPVAKLGKVKKGIDAAGGLRKFIDKLIDLADDVTDMRELVGAYGPVIKEALDIVSDLVDIAEVCFD